MRQTGAGEVWDPQNYWTVTLWEFLMLLLFHIFCIEVFLGVVALLFMYNYGGPLSLMLSQHRENVLIWLRHNAKTTSESRNTPTLFIVHVICSKNILCASRWVYSQNGYTYKKKFEGAQALVYVFMTAVFRIDQYEAYMKPRTWVSSRRNCWDIS